MKEANGTNHGHISHFNQRAKNWWMKQEAENMILIRHIVKLNCVQDILKKKRNTIDEYSKI